MGNKMSKKTHIRYQNQENQESKSTQFQKQVFHIR